MSGRASLWLGLLGGTAAWAAHLLVSYFVVGAGCGNLADDFVRALLLAVTLAAGALAAIALAIARRFATTATAWRRSLARAGVLLDALGLFGIALAGTLPFTLRTC